MGHDQRPIVLTLTSYNMELAQLILLRKYVEDYKKKHSNLKWYVCAHDLGISPTTMYALRKKMEDPYWQEKLSKIPLE